MDERCAQILKKIIFAEKPLKIAELADTFKVSPRTVRYDLDEIDNFLKDNNLPQLVRKPKLGIQFVESREAKDKALSLIEGMRGYDYALSPQEREKVILSELFRARSYVTIGHLADLMSVSRGTVINDLKRVRRWLASHDLKLESSPRYGIKVEGNEAALRRAVIALLLENMDIERALDVIRAPVYRHISVTVDEQVKKLFEDLDVSLIEKAVRMAEEQLSTVFSDVAYSGLVIHLALAIKRIQLGKDITMPKSDLEGLRFTKEFAVASSIAKNLEECFQIRIPEAEIGYITVRLLGGKVTAADTFRKEDWPKLQFLTAKIIQDVQAKVGADFSSDEELYKGLMEHLGPTLYRLKHGLPLKNPILEEIKRNYGDIFKAVEGSLDALKNFARCEIPEEEVGFIAVHFGAAMERAKSKAKKFYRVLVVCGTGVGTAKLLSSRIKAEFDNIEIAGIVPCHQLQDFVSKNRIDLVISTVPVSESLAPNILVNPMLPEEDVHRIKKLINDYTSNSNDRKESCRSLVGDLMKIIEKHCIIKSRAELALEITEYLRNSCQVLSKEVVQPLLDELITEKTVRLNIEAEDWEDAVRKGGEILVENGFVAPSYVEAMVKNVKEVGPYIVIAPGIAMPHARPEDGVKQVCMSLITLRNPVEFGNKTNDPVRLVISFGAVDPYSHLKALSKLMNLFTNKDYIDTILKTSDVNEILKIIKACSKMEG